ncbi:MAG: hypothetical protein KGN77_16820 [Xanthomonadaceae bacterium]|nr:hypothetical protein [Xanthomonadaceae bacterium]MDE1964095.1 hypothetical protein [Xanthomonadaceae bacterium]
MAESMLGQSDRRALEECAEKLGMTPEEALREAVSNLHALVHEGQPPGEASRHRVVARPPHETDQPVPAGTYERPVHADHAAGGLWRAMGEGVRLGLRDARHLAKQYFAPLIALAYWMHDVTEGVMNRKRP